MGQPRISLHVRATSSDGVAQAMAGVTSRRAEISTPAGRWVTVWDEASSNSAVELERVARQLSAGIPACVIALSVSKDEVIYLIYDAGICLDRYDSCRDYYGDVSEAEKTAVAGRAEVLARFTPPGTPFAQIEDVLHGYAFDKGDTETERARGAALADLLGITRGRVDSAWNENDDGSATKLITVENTAGILRQELFATIKSCNDVGVAFLLDRGVPVDSTDDFGCTTLQRAVGTEYPFDSYVSPERLEVVRLLISRGASRSTIQSALCWAALRHAIPIVAALVDAGADINVVDEYGRTAIFAALSHPFVSPDVVAWFIRAGANLSVRVTMSTFILTRSITPLHVSIRAHHVEVIRLLLDAGADPHARDGDGHTPLIAAALLRKPDAVRLLLAAGGVEDARMPNGASVLSFLIQMRKQSVRDDLLEQTIDMISNAKG